MTKLWSSGGVTKSPIVPLDEMTRVTLRVRPADLGGPVNIVRRVGFDPFTGVRVFKQYRVVPEIWS